MKMKISIKEFKKIRRSLNESSSRVNRLSVILNNLKGINPDELIKMYNELNNGELSEKLYDLII